MIVIIDMQSWHEACKFKYGMTCACVGQLSKEKFYNSVGKKSFVFNKYAWKWKFFAWHIFLS